jgi:hypothetical protein
MYHPHTLLKLAHVREAELVREARRCGMPAADTDRGTARPVRRLLATVIVVAPVILLILWIVAAR